MTPRARVTMRGVATVKGQVPVSGVCSNGHTTAGTSDKGRVTAEATCAECGSRVKLRRVRTGAGPTAPTQPEQPAGDKPADRFQVVEVTYSDQPHPRTPARADRAAGDDPGPGGGGTEHAAGPAPEVSDPGPHHSTEQHRDGFGKWRRRRPRLDRAQRADARAAVHDEWIVPGVIPR